MQFDESLIDKLFYLIFIVVYFGLIDEFVPKAIVNALLIPFQVGFMPNKAKVYYYII